LGPTTDILSAKDLVFSYSDGHQALRGVTVALDEGSKVALVGPNGAGKSTLMLMFNAILRPTTGSVLFRQKAISYSQSSVHEIRKHVGMVLQNPDDQIFAPTVYQDVAFGPINLGYPQEKVDRYVGYALSYVGLSGYEKRPPHHLSGGEKKRVALAGVLAMEPDVLVLDEPTSNLDPASAEEIMEMLDELNLYGKTVIIATHDVELAYRWADQVVLMDSGMVLRQGPPEDVFSETRILRRARMKLPVVVELYREMAARGLIERTDSPPKSVLALLDMMDRQARADGRQRSLARPGKIFVCDLEKADAGSIRDLLSFGQASYIGAMGTRAKLMAQDEQLDLDFSYGVIDKCILKAIAGKTSLIITSGGMVERAITRIREYSAESGVRIEAEELNNRPPVGGVKD